MLSRKLQEVKERLEAKSTYSRTEQERELLQELQQLDKFLSDKAESTEFRESVRKHAQITSGPGACPCCGK